MIDNAVTGNVPHVPGFQKIFLRQSGPGEGKTLFLRLISCGIGHRKFGLECGLRFQPPKVTPNIYIDWVGVGLGWGFFTNKRRFHYRLIFAACKVPLLLPYFALNR